MVLSKLARRGKWLCNSTKLFVVGFFPTHLSLTYRVQDTIVVYF